MKRLSVLTAAMALAAIVLTSCEDVPSPFGTVTPPSQTTPASNIPAAGTGVVADPYNVQAVLDYVKSLGADVESPEEVYVKGIVTSISEISAQYGNASFVLSDDTDGSNKFTVYRVKGFGNQKVTDEEIVKIGDEVIICGKVVYYRGNTPETVQNSSYIYSVNGNTGGSSTGGTQADATGTGTLASPFNVSGVLNFISTLGADKTSDDVVYIKGKVKAVTEQFGTQYGNGTFTMIDDGFDAEFTAYRILYLGNVKYSSGETVKAGDEVIVCGKVVNFRGNTPETAQNTGYLYSLNGDTGSGQTPTPAPTVEAKGSGTQADPYNVQAIYNIVSVLDANQDLEAEYYLKGTVKSIPNNGISTQYNNVSFYLTDDGSNEFYVFRAKGLNGGDVTENMLKVGDEVVVCGSKWVNYQGTNGNTTPETKQGEAYIVSITAGSGGGSEPGSGGGTVTDSGYEITMSAFGLANAAELTTLTTTDGIQLTFSQESGTNSPKYYTSGTSARMYAFNSLTISGSKTMTKVILTCAMNGSNAANGNDQMYGEADGQKVTTSKDSNTQVTFSGFSGKTLKIVNDYTQDSAGTQLRIQKITIVYAD